jgi:RNA polymerase-binding transcription factor DksA
MSATALLRSHAPLGSLEETAIRRLREALVTDRAAQASQLAENQATVSALTGQRDVDSLLEREIAEASVAHARDAIEDIDDAIASMDTGTYGVCESCGTPIPLERLEAVPRARCCVTCSGQSAGRRR